MTEAPVDRRAIPPGAIFSTWKASDGWALRRLDWRQPDGAPVRGQLFFTGGRGDFAEKYIEALWHWHGRGWNLTSLDWRGQGGSRGTAEGGHHDSMDLLVDDCAAFLKDWTGERTRPCVAVAHSMGGHLLLRALAEHRPPIDAAVLAAPMLSLVTTPIPARLAPTIALLRTILGGRRPAWRIDKEGPQARIRQANLTGCSERYADEQYWKQREPGYELGVPSWGWLNAAFRSMRRLDAHALASVQTPVLLLGTDRDRLVSAAAIRRAAASLPRAELFMFADAAHELLRETDEIRVEAFARIDAFLDEHAAR